MGDSHDDRAAAVEFLEELKRLTGQLEVYYSGHNPTITDHFRALRSLSKRVRTILMVEAALAVRAEFAADATPANLKFAEWTSQSAWIRLGILGDLQSAISRSKLPYESSQIRQIAELYASVPTDSLDRHNMGSSFFRIVEQAWPELEKDIDFRAVFDPLFNNLSSGYNLKSASVTARLRLLVAPPGELPLAPHEPWADAARDHFSALPDTARVCWLGLFTLCAQASTGSPPKRWTKQACEILEECGVESIRDALCEWLPLVDKRRTQPWPTVTYHDEETAAQLLLDDHATILKGLCWVASTIPDASLARVLGDLAISCYRKVPGIGPRAVKVGNAAVYALGRMPGRHSLGQLALLRIKVKFGTAQKLIEKALDAAAEREGLPRDEIEEMAVPAYGLTGVGVRRETLGDYTAELTISGSAGASSTTLGWVNAKGKRVRSVPAAVKRDHPDDLKELKGAAKDIQKMLPAQRDRLDGLFLAQKTWAFGTWRERYLDHPLVGTIARRLIWLFDDGDASIAAAWLADDAEGPTHGTGRLVDVRGEPVEVDPDSVVVSLWHPIDAGARADAPGGTRGDVLAWRAFYEDRRIRQPFKQAHREVYLLTDAERSTDVYSNRFAAHVLRQHQFAALCGQRGWKNRLRLMVDDEYPPAHRLLDAWGLRAEFWVEGVGDDYVDTFVLESGAYRFLTTDQVRFYEIGAAQSSSHAGGGGYHTYGVDEAENQPLPLDRIPPIVLSEVLRDVDLFVGVASVGNNPEWQDGGPEGRFVEYWHAYSFGDLTTTARSRRELLERLIPRLEIAPACTVTDRFLVVIGKRRTYKIHLGSSNILMEPNDEYLCIVPNQRMESAGSGGGPGGGLFLPFEGDRTLAVILSKAFMLAADDAITDPTILSQIGRGVRGQ